MPPDATLLIIDDDPAAQLALEALLTAQGYELHFAPNGEEGLRLAAQCRPDVILLDVMMPGLNGYAVCRRLRADPHLAEVPILMLTALIETEARLEGLRAGADDFLSKPFDIPELLARLQTITRLNRFRQLHAEREYAAQLAETLQTVVNAVAESLLLIEADGKVLFINATAAGHLGRLPAQVTGQCVYDFLPPDLAARRRAHVETARRTRQPVRFEDTHRGQLLEHSLHPILDADGLVTCVAILAVDITEQRRTQAALQAMLEKRVADRTRELRTLYAIAALSSQTRDLPSMLEQALALVITATGQASGALHLLEETDTLRMVACQGLPEAAAAALAQVTVAPIWRERLSEIYLPVVHLDSQLAPGLFPPAPLAAFRAYLSVPLHAREQVLGVMTLFEGEKPAFATEDIALLTTVADQVGLTVESVRLHQQAQQVAVISERQRLARGLHDSATQSLYSLTLLAEIGRQELNQGAWALVGEELTQINTIAQQALKDLRRMVYELRPQALEQAGLVGALQARLDAVEKRSGVTARLFLDDPEELLSQKRLPAETEQELYYIGTEALNNALKHAGATAVTIRVEVDQAGLGLDVGDNGRGFDPTALPSGGQGLSAMRERARLLGGALAIHAAPGQGTRITVRINWGN